MEALRVTGLVTAAGLSSRMGEFKPLLPFRDSTVIECAVGSLLSGGAERTAVVTGYRADELEAVLKQRFGDKVITVRNPDFAGTDMMGSVKIGCGVLPKCDAFFLLPGDMPMIGRGTFRAVLAAFSDKTDAVFPTLSGRRKHPPLIAERLIPDIIGYRGEDGLRGFFRTLSRVAEVETGDPGTDVDLDTPEIYRRYFFMNDQAKITKSRLSSEES